MFNDSIKDALDQLRAERETIDAAIEALQSAVGEESSPASRHYGAKTKKAPRGLLKEKIHEVLEASRSPVAPADLRDRLIRAGYPVKSPKSLYTAIFAAANKDSMIEKTPKGYRLKAAGRKAAR